MKEIRNRVAWDIFCLAIIVLPIFLPLGENNHHPVLSRIAILMFCVAFMCLFPLRWPRRLKEHNKRQRLLSLPVVHDTGILSPAIPKKVDSMRIGVPTGYSENISNGNIYEHYSYEDVGVYDGQWASFAGKKGVIFLETLPRSFWGEEESIPHCHPGKATNVALDYVTDTDGKSYYINSRLI